MGRLLFGLVLPCLVKTWRVLLLPVGRRQVWAVCSEWWKMEQVSTRVPGRVLCSYKLWGVFQEITGNNRVGWVERGSPLCLRVGGRLWPWLYCCPAGPEVHCTFWGKYIDREIWHIYIILISSHTTFPRQSPLFILMLYLSVTLKMSSECFAKVSVRTLIIVTYFPLFCLHFTNRHSTLSSKCNGCVRISTSQ